MKPFSVTFKKSAFKELQKLSQKMRQKVIDAVNLLALNPYTELLPIKKLKGADDLYRIRVQDYRVIYTLDGKAVKIVLIKIGNRKDVYS